MQAHNDESKAVLHTSILIVPALWTAAAITARDFHHLCFPIHQRRSNNPIVASLYLAENIRNLCSSEYPDLITVFSTLRTHANKASVKDKRNNPLGITEWNKVVNEQIARHHNVLDVCDLLLQDLQGQCRDLATFGRGVCLYKAWTSLSSHVRCPILEKG